MKSTSTDRTLATMRAEVAALKKEISLLKKAVASLSKPGPIHAPKAVVGSLEVVNSAGKVVASIDGKGAVFCGSVWASKAPNQRGVFLGGAQRLISAGALELIEPNAQTAGLEARSRPDHGEIRVRSLKTKQFLHLQGSGAPIMAFAAETGSAAAVLSTNGVEGGTLELTSGKPENRGKVRIRGASPGGNAGQISVTDASGGTVLKLP